MISERSQSASTIVEKSARVEHGSSGAWEQWRQEHARSSVLADCSGHLNSPLQYVGEVVVKGQDFTWLSFLGL